MVTGIALGMLCGVGVWLIAAGLRPRRPSLAETMANLHRPPADTTAAAGGLRSSWRQRFEQLAMLIASTTSRPATQTQDLAVLGRTATRHAIDKLTYAAFFAALPMFTSLVMAAAGVAVPALPVLLTTGAGVAGGLLIPDRTVRREAARRRVEFRTALSAYVDLVVAAMAAGTAAEGALVAAADIGDGWAFTQLRAAIAIAARDNASPWEALGRLAEDLALSDLTELTSSMTLVGESGARVRASLTAKAQALRDHHLADAQADAESSSERMSVPVVALMTAFLMLVGYPALARVLSL